MQKIVIAKTHSGFQLSKRALDAYARAKGIPLDRQFDDDHKLFAGSYAGIREDDIPRDDPDLVRIVKRLGQRAHRSPSDLKLAQNKGRKMLKVVEVPAGVRWQIEDYDGIEWVAEKHRTWGVGK